MRRMGTAEENCSSNMPPIFRKLRATKVGEHKIKPIEGAELKQGCLYHIPWSLEGVVTTQANELLKLSLIYRCESPSAQQLVCVSKDGMVRMRVNYRNLNAITKPRALPMS